MRTFTRDQLRDPDQLFQILQEMERRATAAEGQLAAFKSQLTAPHLADRDLAAVSEALSARGSHPLNVTQLIGILAQSQRGFAVVSSSAATLPDPQLYEVGTVGAVLSGGTYGLYLVQEGNPRTWITATLTPPANMMTTDTNQAVSGQKSYSSEQLFRALTALTLGGAAATHAGKHQFIFQDEEITLSTVGVTTDSAANLLSSSSLVLPLLAFITQTISGGGVTKFRTGDPTTNDRFRGDDANLAVGNGFWMFKHWAGSVATDATGPTQGGAAKVRITTDAAPTQGKIRIVTLCLVGTPPTS